MDLSYFQLRAHLYPYEDNKTVDFKLKDIENIWFCTAKNVKRKLRKFEEENKLSYQPGQGRGHLSKLTFHQTFKYEVEQQVTNLIAHENIEELIQLVQLPLPKSWVINFSEDIQAVFGLQSLGDSKDVLRSILTRELTTLDPGYASITFESHLLLQLGDTLVTYDQKNEKVNPHIAHYWEVTDNQKTWIFYLRKGVMFHHLRELTSEDIAYTFYRLKEKRCPFSWLVSEIDEVKCNSKFSVQITLKKPNPFFLRYLSTPNLIILPHDIPFDEYQWIGTGPFLMKERTEDKLILKAFDHYFMERPLLDEIEFYLVPPEATNEVNYQIKGRELEGDITTKVEIEIGFRFLGFNFRKETIVQNTYFRQAIFHLLNMQKMHRDLQRDPCIEASSYFYWKSEKQTKQPERIPELLAKSGYEGEKLIVYSLNHQSPREEVQWFCEEARSYGIHFEIVYFGIDELYLSNIDNHADLIFLGEVASTDYHLSFLGAFYNDALLFRRLLAESDLIYIDSALELFKKANNTAEREDIINQIEAYIKAKNLFIFMSHPLRSRAFHSMIRAIHFDAYSQIDFKKLWIHPDNVEN